MYDVLIIGGGPAGISSSIYAVSRGLKTAVLEQKAIGGLLGSVSTVTHYSGIMEHETGKSFAKRLEHQARESGVELLMESVIRVELSGEIKQIYTENNVYKAKAVIVAAGTRPRQLEIPGESELTGTGLNAWKDGPAYEGKDIFVVGGADGAVKEALYLSKFAKQLTIIHFEDQLGAIPEFTEKVEETSNISLKLHSRLVEISRKNCVNQLTIRDEHTGETEIVTSNGCGVFIYAGSIPNTELFSELKKSDGYLICNEKMETNLPGVYAAGDICVKQVRQAATAVSDGAIAGINAAAYIKTLS